MSGGDAQALQSQIRGRNEHLLGDLGSSSLVTIVGLEDGGNHSIHKIASDQPLQG
jgi:hypothetical protein